MARGCEASDCRPARGYEVLLSRKSNLEWADTRRRSEARRSTKIYPQKCFYGEGMRGIRLQASEGIRGVIVARIGFRVSRYEASK